jgi:hypothetical protein
MSYIAVYVVRSGSCPECVIGIGANKDAVCLPLEIPDRAGEETGTNKPIRRRTLVMTMRKMVRATDREILLDVLMD